MMKKRKRYDRLAAFMLAMVVAATSCMPAVSQPVYAAPEDESTDAGSPFGVNVALGNGNVFGWAVSGDDRYGGGS